MDKDVVGFRVAGSEGSLSVASDDPEPDSVGAAGVGGSVGVGSTTAELASVVGPVLSATAAVRGEPGGVVVFSGDWVALGVGADTGSDGGGPRDVG